MQSFTRPDRATAPPASAPDPFHTVFIRAIDTALSDRSPSPSTHSFLCRQCSPLRHLSHHQRPTASAYFCSLFSGQSIPFPINFSYGLPNTPNPSSTLSFPLSVTPTYLSQSLHLFYYTPLLHAEAFHRLTGKSHSPSANALPFRVPCA